MSNIGRTIKEYCKNKDQCKDTKFFTQFTVEEHVKVPDQKPDVEEVISAIVDSKIVSLNVIDTAEGTSYEGQNLSGKKIAVEIELRQKIMYISNTVVQSVHVVENLTLQSVYVVVPKLIYGSKPEDLIKCKYFNPKIVIENVMAEKIDCRNIFKNIIIFIEFTLVTSYLLCYSESHGCKESSLYLTYNDGTNKKKIAYSENYEISEPQWAPCGQRVAYICCEKDSSFLCVSDVKGNNTYQLTDTDVFKYVSSFSWCADESTILFTAFFKNNKDIFSLNLNTLEWKQLTYGAAGCNSKKPKASFDGEYIAYIKSVNDNSNLYMMKKNGLGTKKITNLVRVKDFIWENNNLRIAVACHESDENKCKNKKDLSLGCEKSGDEIFLVDIKCNDRVCLNISKLNLKIKKIKYSQDNRYIGFIGERLGIEDIYLYDLLKNEIINLTENEYGINISDYDWNIDSSCVYYSCNELNYYNVYFVCICDKAKTQISNTRAKEIKLCFRPKIL